MSGKPAAPSPRELTELRDKVDGDPHLARELTALAGLLRGPEPGSDGRSMASGEANEAGRQTTTA